MTRSRRVATALAGGVILPFVLLLLAPGVAHADDCSSPTDCSNTAWTVAGAAAAAAAIVGAAMATQGNGRSEGRCAEVKALRESIRARYQRLADLAVLRKGARRSQARAEDQLRRAREWATRLEGKVQVSTTEPGVAASAGSATAATAGAYADKLQAALATAKDSQTAGQRLAELTGRAGPAGSQLRSAAEAGGRVYSSGFWSKANRAFSAIGFGLSSIGHYFNFQHRNDMRTLGILQQTIVQKRAEIERWRSYSTELTGKIDGGVEALRGDVRRSNELNAEHECGWTPLDIDQMRSLLDAPPDVEGGAVGIVPQHVLETEPPIRRATADERAEERDRDRERPVCQQYDADLAAWNTLVAEMTPELDRWDRELRQWAARGAAVRRVMATRGEIQRQVNEVIWGVTGNALGERAVAGAELGMAWVGLFTLSAPVVVALALGGIVASVARGKMAPRDAELIAEGRIAAEMRFWSSRLVYINAEITRITRMRTEVLSELQRRRIRLDRTHAWCSSWWDDRGEHHERAEPVPVSYRRDYGDVAAFPSARYSAMPIADLMQEIRTWR